MAKLIWDGDEEREENPEEITPPDEDEAENEGVEIEETLENTTRESNDPVDNPGDCQHPWQSVSREKMKRVVQGSTIDTKSIYWCNSCQSILDTIE
jgi:hypothetical protein